MRPSSVLHTVAVLLLSSLSMNLTAQVQTPLQVGPFGGVNGRLPPVPVPSELRAFVPEGSVLRLELQTQISRGGETLLLYDDGERIFPRVCLSAIRSGKAATLFDESVSGFAGVLPAYLQGHRQVVAFAYHSAGDGADTSFVIFAAESDRYVRIFERETIQGQLRILSESPLKIELWWADQTRDPGESCVWCPHLYGVETYIWGRNAFKLVTRRTTPTALLPGAIARYAFQAGPNEK